MELRPTGRFAPGAEKVLPADLCIDKRYRIRRPVGLSPYSTSYVAVDKTTQHRVTVKVLHRRTALDADAVRRSESTALKAAACAGEFVQTLLDAGTLESGARFQVYEPIEGQRVDRVLGERGLAMPLGLEIFHCALEGIAAVHAAGVVHGQLSSSSLWLQQGEDGSVSGLVCEGFGEAYLHPGEGAGEQRDRPPQQADDVLALVCLLRICLEHSEAQLPAQAVAPYRRIVEALLSAETTEHLPTAQQLIESLDSARSREPSDAPGPGKSLVSTHPAGLGVDVPQMNHPRNQTRQGLAPPGGLPVIPRYRRVQEASASALLPKQVELEAGPASTRGAAAAGPGEVPQASPGVAAVGHAPFPGAMGSGEAPVIGRGDPVVAPRDAGNPFYSVRENASAETRWIMALAVSFSLAAAVAGAVVFLNSNAKEPPTVTSVGSRAQHALHPAPVGEEKLGSQGDKNLPKGEGAAREEQALGDSRASGKPPEADAPPPALSRGRASARAHGARTRSVSRTRRSATTEGSEKAVATGTKRALRSGRTSAEVREPNVPSPEASGDLEADVPASTRRIRTEF